MIIMEHSIAQAIRTVGAQMCRRLDVLIEAAGKPPVQDIEGTSAPRKPLAPSAMLQIARAARADASSPPSDTPAPKKRGRPPTNKQQLKAKNVSVAFDSSENESCEVVYCPNHELFSLIHGEKSFQKESYTRAEMLAFGIKDFELAAAVEDTPTCRCLPWVCSILVFLFAFIDFFFQIDYCKEHKIFWRCKGFGYELEKNPKLQGMEVLFWKAEPRPGDFPTPVFFIYLFFVKDAVATLQQKKFLKPIIKNMLNTNRQN